MEEAAVLFRSGVLMAAPQLIDAQISLTSPLVPQPQGAAAGRESLQPSAQEAQWDRILEELLRLGSLGDDWDGQGARALDPANVAQASAWVREMRRWHRAMSPTRVLPGTLGEVVLEWRGDAYYLAAEISTPSQVEWVLNVPGQPIKQWATDARGPWIVRGEP
jgi:hypothetical protein